MPMDLYDRAGYAVAYTDDDEHIYLYTGEAVSYLVDGALYTYRGEQLGWCDTGWIRDKDGRCVAFSEAATNGPSRPPMGIKPPQAVRQGRPPKEPRDPRALRPIHSNAWSTLSAREFFANRSHRWPGGTRNGGNTRGGQSTEA